LFPEHLRLGVPTGHSLVLAGRLRHRSASVELGRAAPIRALDPNDHFAILLAGQALLENDAEHWRTTLGALVYERSRDDLRRLANNA
jgi:hypothetical protein